MRVTLNNMEELAVKRRYKIGLGIFGDRAGAGDWHSACVDAGI